MREREEREEGVGDRKGDTREGREGEREEGIYNYNYVLCLK